MSNENERMKDLEEGMRELEKRIEVLDSELDSVREGLMGQFSSLRDEIKTSLKDSDEIRYKTREDLGGKIDELKYQHIEVRSEYKSLKSELENVAKSSDKLISKIDDRDKYIVNTVIGFVVSVVLLIMGAYFFI